MKRRIVENYNPFRNFSKIAWFWERINKASVYNMKMHFISNFIGVLGERRQPIENQPSIRNNEKRRKVQENFQESFPAWKLLLEIFTTFTVFIECCWLPFSWSPMHASFLYLIPWCPNIAKFLNLKEFPYRGTRGLTHIRRPGKQTPQREDCNKNALSGNLH